MSTTERIEDVKVGRTSRGRVKKLHTGQRARENLQRTPRKGQVSRTSPHCHPISGKRKLPSEERKGVQESSHYTNNGGCRNGMRCDDIPVSRVFKHVSQPDCQIEENSGVHDQTSQSQIERKPAGHQECNTKVRARAGNWSLHC